MARQRTIVGIGDALLAEFPDRSEPGGLALHASIQAARFGHRGVPIARIGQDEHGAQLFTLLAEHELDVAHLQHDPDHQTGRLKVQRIGRRVRVSVDPHAAFDELQWDFDLSDVAPVADAVVCGARGWRCSQARSVLERFLDEASSALRIAVMECADELDELRSSSRGILERVDLLVADETSIQALIPRSSEAALTELAGELCRSHQLASVAISCDEGGEMGLTMVSGSEIAVSKSSVVLTEEIASDVPSILAVGLAHGLLSGWEDEACISLVLNALRVSITPDQRRARLPDDITHAPSSNGSS